MTSAKRPKKHAKRHQKHARQEKALQDAIKDAEVACDGGSAGECAAAWDNVEEISAAISHKKAEEAAAAAAAAAADPLEVFCGDNPDADECRVYDD